MLWAFSHHMSVHLLWSWWPLLLSCHILSMLWRSIILWKIHLTCYYSHDGGLTGCLLTSFGVLVAVLHTLRVLVSIFCSLCWILPSMNSTDLFPFLHSLDLLAEAGWLFMKTVSSSSWALARLHFPAFQTDQWNFMDWPNTSCVQHSPIPPLPLPYPEAQYRQIMTTLFKSQVLQGHKNRRILDPCTNTWVVVRGGFRCSRTSEPSYLRWVRN